MADIHGKAAGATAEETRMMRARLAEVIFPNERLTDAQEVALEEAVLYQIEHERRGLSKGAVLPQGMSAVKVGILNLAQPQEDGVLSRKTMCRAAYGVLLSAGLLYKGVER